MAREYLNSIQRFLKAESSSHEVEQDIYHLLELLHDKQDANVYKSIGAKALLPLLAYFSDARRATRARRWAGYVLLRLLTMSAPCRQRLENGSEDLRRGIGALMLTITSDDLKIVAGRIIRVMCAGKLPAEEYFPTDERGRATATKFPAGSDGDSQWVSENFQDFIEDLVTQKLLKFADSEVSRPLAILLDDEAIDRQDGSFLVLVGKSVTVIVTPSNGVVQYIDIPIHNISAVKSTRQNLQITKDHASNQAAPPTIVLHLVSKEWTLLHNAARKSYNRVSFIFSEENAEECADTATWIEEQLAEYRKGQTAGEGSATAHLDVKRSDSPSAERAPDADADEWPLPSTSASQGSQKSSTSQTLALSRLSHEKAKPASPGKKTDEGSSRPLDGGEGQQADTNSMPPPSLPLQARDTRPVKDARTVLAVPDQKFNPSLPEPDVPDMSSIPRASQIPLPADFIASSKESTADRLGDQEHQEISPLPPQEDDDFRGLYDLSPAGQKAHDLHVERILSSQRNNERSTMHDVQTLIHNSGQYIDPRDLHYSDPGTVKRSQQAHSEPTIGAHLNAKGMKSSNDAQLLEVTSTTHANKTRHHGQQDPQPPGKQIPNRPSVAKAKSNKAQPPAPIKATTPKKTAVEAPASSHGVDGGKAQAAENPVARAHAHSAKAPSSKETQQSSGGSNVQTNATTRKAPKLKDLLRSEDGKTQSDLQKGSDLAGQNSTTRSTASKAQPSLPRKQKPATTSAAKSKKGAKSKAGAKPNPSQGQKRKLNNAATDRAEGDHGDEQEDSTAKKSGKLKAKAAKSTTGSLQSLKGKSSGAGSVRLRSGNGKQQETPDIFHLPEDDEPATKKRRVKKQKNAGNNDDEEYGRRPRTRQSAAKVTTTTTRARVIRNPKSKPIVESSSVEQDEEDGEDPEDESREEDSPLKAKSQSQTAPLAVPRAKGQRQPKFRLQDSQPLVERNAAETDVAKAPAATETTQKHTHISTPSTTDEQQRVQQQEDSVQGEDDAVVPPPFETDESQHVLQQEASVQHEDQAVALEPPLATALQHQRYEGASRAHEDDAVVLAPSATNNLQQSALTSVSVEHGTAEALVSSALDEQEQLHHQASGVAHDPAPMAAPPVPDKSHTVNDQEASVAHAVPPVPVSNTDEAGLAAGSNEGIVSKLQPQGLTVVHGRQAEEEKADLAPIQQALAVMQARHASYAIEELTNHAGEGPPLSINIIHMHMYATPNANPYERGLPAALEGPAPSSSAERVTAPAAEGSVAKTHEVKQAKMPPRGPEHRQVEATTNTQPRSRSSEAPNAGTMQGTKVPQSRHAVPTKEATRNKEDFEAFEDNVVNYSGDEEGNKVIDLETSVIIIDDVEKENIPHQDALQAKPMDLQDTPRKTRRRAPKPLQGAQTPPHPKKDLQSTPKEQRKRAPKPLQEAQSPAHPKKRRTLPAGQGPSARHDNKGPSSKPDEARTYQPPMTSAPQGHIQPAHANVHESELIDENVIRKAAMVHFDETGPVNQGQLSGRKRKSEEPAPAPRKVKVSKMEAERLGRSNQESPGQFSDSGNEVVPLISDDIAHKTPVRDPGWDQSTRLLHMGSKRELANVVLATATPPPANKGGKLVVQEVGWVGESESSQSDTVQSLDEGSSRLSHRTRGDESPHATFSGKTQPNVRQRPGPMPIFEDADSTMVAGENFLDGAQDVKGLDLNNIGNTDEVVENHVQYVQSRNGKPVLTVLRAGPSAITHPPITSPQPADARTNAAPMGDLSAEAPHNVSAGKQPTNAQTRFVRSLEARAGEHDGQAVQDSRTAKPNTMSASGTQAMAAEGEEFYEDTTLVNEESEPEDSGAADDDEEESVREERSSGRSSGDRTEGRKQEMAWEDSLRPDQYNMLEVLCRISHKVLRHLASTETGVSDIVADYTSDGEKLLSQMEKCHGEDLETYTKSNGDRMRTLRTGLNQAAKALSKDSRTFEGGRDGAKAGIKHVEWTKESRKGSKELEGCLISLEDLGRMVA